MNRNESDKIFNLTIENTVQIKYLKKIWIIVGFSFTIILSIFSFFGLDKIKSIEKYAEEKVNLRLKKSDSLIALLDDKRIIEINEKIKEKEKDYKIILSNLDNLIHENEEIQNKVLLLMPVNELVTKDHYVSNFDNVDDRIFSIINFPSKIKNNQICYVYVSISSLINTDTLTTINLDISKKIKDNNSLMINYQSFKPKRGLNKLYVKINTKAGLYTLSVSITTKSKLGYIRDVYFTVE